MVKKHDVCGAEKQLRDVVILKANDKNFADTVQARLDWEFCLYG